MATYIVLGNFTDQGLRHARESTKRAEAFREMARVLGVGIKNIYWTMGQYDVVVVIDAPDNATATTLNISLGALGNVRTQTLPAFTADEMAHVIAKMV